MTPTYIIFHTFAAQGDHDAKTVDRWHRDRGFAGIGYHYIIKKDGTVERGRAENKTGAHCRDMGMNRKSIGISMAGHHNLEDWTPEQEVSFYQLAAGICDRHGIPAKRVLGHRETGARKDCPGTRISPDGVRGKLEQTLVRPRTRIYEKEGEKLKEVPFTVPAQDMEKIPTRPVQHIKPKHV